MWHAMVRWVMWNSGRETTRKREKMLQWAWQASECSQTKSWFWFVYLFHVCITFVLRWTYSLVLQTNRALLKHKAMIHTLLMFPICFPHSYCNQLENATARYILFEHFIFRMAVLTFSHMLTWVLCTCLFKGVYFILFLVSTSVA